MLARSPESRARIEEQREILLAVLTIMTYIDLLQALLDQLQVSCPLDGS